MTCPPTYELVARICKAKGLNGQLVAQDLGSELSFLRAGLEVWVVPPNQRGVRQTSIAAAESSPGKPGVVLTLEGVASRSAALELEGRYLLASSAALGNSQPLPFLTEPDEDAARQASTGNTAAEDQAAGATPGSLVAALAFEDVNYGNLGTLSGTKPGPAYDIWLVDGPYGHLEIPAVAEYIQAEGARQTTLLLPTGFIEATAQEGRGDAAR